MKKKTIVTITIVALLVGGVLLSGHLVKGVAASAQSTPSASLTTQDIKGGSEDELAAALGITVEEVDAAQEKAFTSAVDAALEAEYITASQAETLKSGDGWFNALYRYLSDTERAEFDQNSFLAEALGISESELTEAYAAVQQAEIDQLVADGVITQDEADLRAAWQALQQSDTFAESYKQAMTDAINAEVEAGSITQAQADLLIAQLDEMPAGFGFGMHGMRGMEGDGKDRPEMEGSEGFGGRGKGRGPGGF